MLGLWAPLFAPVNPQNAQSPGFEAANFGTGLMGSISGVPVYMDAGLAAGAMLLISSSALEVYEDRIGSLQVVEPSVLGVQVAYAGYFCWLIVDAGRDRQDHEDAMTEYDAPNQQVVRPDASAPWDEGEGGSAGEAPGPTATATSDRSDLDEMTKAELLDYGQSIGASPANNNMTKEELRASVDQKLAEA